MKLIERFSITDEAVKQIKAELLSGKYQIGDKLATERELSEQLGVGRSTIREALKALRALGFVEILQGKGAFVRKTDEDTDDKIRDWFARHEFQLSDFIEVRMSLEPLGVRLAVERGSKKEIAKIGEILEVFEKAMMEGSVVDQASADELFHSAIMEATHNKLLIAINRKISESFRDYRMRSFAVRETASNALVPHQRIFKAIAARDATGAVREMTRHLEISLADVHAAVGTTAQGRT